MPASNIFFIVGLSVHGILLIVKIIFFLRTLRTSHVCVTPVLPEIESLAKRKKCPEVLKFSELQSTDRWLADWAKMYLHKQFGEFVFSSSTKRNKILTLGDRHWHGFREIIKQSTLHA